MCDPVVFDHGVALVYHSGRERIAGPRRSDRTIRCRAKYRAGQGIVEQMRALAPVGGVHDRAWSPTT